MASNTCPICDRSFNSPGALRDHAWDEHGACHYCGDEVGDDQRSLYVHWLAAHPHDLTRVDEKRAESAVDSLSLSERYAEGGAGAALQGVSRRTVLAGGGLVIGGTILAGASALGGNGGGGTDGPAGGPTGNSTAPVPPSPEKHRYAAMGTGEADVTVTYFGNFKCPYCAQFDTGFLRDIVADYVAPGKITLQYRNLTWAGGRPFLGPDGPAAARAGLAVWNDDPANYWNFHEYIFAHQPSESKRWATADRLTSFAKKAGVSDLSVVRKAVKQGKYERPLRANTDAASSAGVNSTPMLVVDGTTVAPVNNEKKTRTVIENAIG